MHFHCTIFKCIRVNISGCLTFRIPYGKALLLDRSNSAYANSYNINLIPDIKVWGLCFSSIHIVIFIFLKDC